MRKIYYASEYKISHTLKTPSVNAHSEVSSRAQKFSKIGSAHKSIKIFCKNMKILVRMLKFLLIILSCHEQLVYVSSLNLQFTCSLH